MEVYILYQALQKTGFNVNIYSIVMMILSILAGMIPVELWGVNMRKE